MLYFVLLGEASSQPDPSVKRTVPSAQHHVIAPALTLEQSLRKFDSLLHNDIHDSYANVYRINAIHRREMSSFTEGLFFSHSTLFELSGTRGEPALFSYKALNPIMKIELRADLPPFESVKGADQFGEGSQRFVVLSPQSHKALKFESDLGEAGEIGLPWELNDVSGITHKPGDKTFLVSNGSNKIFEMSLGESATVENVSRIVDKHVNAVGPLGELEWVEDRLWANIVNSSTVAVINLKTKTARFIDFDKLREIANQMSQLINKRDLQPEECMNGIAYDPFKKVLLLTGKNWPSIFEIEPNINFFKI